MIVETESNVQAKPAALSLQNFAGMGSQLACRACYDTDALFVTPTGAEVQLADRHGAVAILGARSVVVLNSVTCMNCGTRTLACE